MICKKTVKKYCKNYAEIENYEKAINDDEEVWDCHHRLETHTSDDELRPIEARLTQKELIALGMYYERPAEELVFLKHFDHTNLHQKGKKCTDEIKRRLSEVNKGKKHTEESKKKMSEVQKGHEVSEETRRKISEAVKGKNKGKKHTEEEKAKMSAAIKKLRWFNDGIKNIRAKECPEGFKPGRIYRRK